MVSLVKFCFKLFVATPLVSGLAGLVAGVGLLALGCTPEVAANGATAVLVVAAGFVMLS